MLKEFREFINRGNVVDLAVGVIIGAAFGKIVTSLVDDVVMPVISLPLGTVDIANKYIPLAGQSAKTLVEAKKEGAVIAYGAFLSNIIIFIVTAFVIFLMVKAMNKMQRAKDEVPAPEALPADVALLTEIRDLLSVKS